MFIFGFIFVDVVIKVNYKVMFVFVGGVIVGVKVVIGEVVVGEDGKVEVWDGIVSVRSCFGVVERVFVVVWVVNIELVEIFGEGF